MKSHVSYIHDYRHIFQSYLGAHIYLVFPLTLVEALLLGQDEHWQVEGWRMFSAERMAKIPSLDHVPA